MRTCAAGRGSGDRAVKMSRSGMAPSSGLWAHRILDKVSFNVHGIDFQADFVSWWRLWPVYQGPWSRQLSGRPSEHQGAGNQPWDIWAVPEAGAGSGALQVAVSGVGHHPLRHTSLASSARAARNPHSPCTPGPGGVEEEQR